MTLEFESITLARQAEYNELFDSCPQYASDYTFANLWGWAEEYELSWAWDDDLVWIRQGSPENCFWAPVGRWDKIDWQRKFAAASLKGTFIRVPEKLVGIWLANLPADLLEVSDSREHWDYLYKVSDLIELKGGRFHRKKNLLNQFLSLYNFEYKIMEKAMVNQTLMMQADWCAWKNCEASAGLTAENRVIERILLEWESFNRLVGGLIIIEDRVVAFTVGELVSPDSLVIHFEKGISDYKGIYQAINNLFMLDNKGVLLVNREQDLGNSGLRKAKMSYQPVDFIEKCKVKIK